MELYHAARDALLLYEAIVPVKVSAVESLLHIESDGLQNWHYVVWLSLVI